MKRLFILIVFLISIVSVEAATLKIYPTDDAFVRSGTGFTSLNYGSETQLRAGANSGNNFGTERTYLKFDLSDVGGAEISSATLNLVRISGQAVTVEAYNVTTNSWYENTINWNNKPSYSPGIVDSVATQAGGEYTWNVSTSIVQGQNTVSFLLKSSNEAQLNVALFYSTENGYDGIWPYLEVEVATPAPFITSVNAPASANEGSAVATSFSANFANYYLILRDGALVGDNKTSDSWQTDYTDAGSHTYTFIANNTVTGQSDTETRTVVINNVPNLVINEFYAYPNATNTSDKEWIELYNPTQSSIDLADKNCFIIDGAYLISGTNNKWTLTGEIQPNDFGWFYTYDTPLNLLNDNGDLIRLNCSGLTYDEVIYGPTNPNWDFDGNSSNNAPNAIREKSIGRYPDGEDTGKDNIDFEILLPTRNTANEKECEDADTSCDGTVSITELLNYIGEWKAGNKTITELLYAISLWKSGGP